MILRLNQTDRGIVDSPSRLLAAVRRFLIFANTTGSARPQIPAGTRSIFAPARTLGRVPVRGTRSVPNIQQRSGLRVWRAHQRRATSRRNLDAKEKRYERKQGADIPCPELLVVQHHHFGWLFRIQRCSGRSKSPDWRFELGAAAAGHRWRATERTALPSLRRQGRQSQAGECKPHCHAPCGIFGARYYSERRPAHHTGGCAGEGCPSG
jgi:hypothetical protein